MNISTVHVKNISKEPVFLTFTTNDSYRVNPAETITISFVEPTSIYYLFHYVDTNKDVEFYDKENTLLTPEVIAPLKESYDIQNGVPPYRDLVAEGELKAYVAAVLENAEESTSGTQDVTINFMAGGTSVHEPVIKKYAVGAVVEDTELKAEYSTVGDYDLDESSATDLTVTEDESKNIINLSYTVAKGQATIKYVDVADSTEIKTAVNKTGDVGAKEVVKPETIEGYENPTPTQKTVTYTRTAQEVVFSYTKKAV